MLLIASQKPILNSESTHFFHDFYRGAGILDDRQHLISIKPVGRPFNMHSAIYMDVSSTCRICFSQEEFANSVFRKRTLRSKLAAQKAFKQSLNF